MAAGHSRGGGKPAIYFSLSSPFTPTPAPFLALVFVVNTTTHPPPVLALVSKVRGLFFAADDGDGEISFDEFMAQIDLSRSQRDKNAERCGQASAAAERQR